MVLCGRAWAYVARYGHRMTDNGHTVHGIITSTAEDRTMVGRSMDYSERDRTAHYRGALPPSKCALCLMGMGASHNADGNLIPRGSYLAFRAARLDPLPTVCESQACRRYGQTVAYGHTHVRV